MPPAQKNIQVDANKHFADYEGTKIQIPKPLEEMTGEDWGRLAYGSKSPLLKVPVSNQSFHGLRVVLKDKNYIPMWLYTGGQRSESKVPRAYDPMERAVSMGATLVSSIDELDEESARYYQGTQSADGHFHRQDVVMAKIPIVAYYAIQAQSIEKSRKAVEYQSTESKAFEGVDMPHYVKGNKEAPLFEATEHSVQYQDRLRMS